MMPKTSFTVIGAGSWGTALALLLARNGHEVALWTKDKKAVDDLKNKRENQKYLPGVVFPDNLTIADDLIKSIDSTREILIAVPSQGFADVLMLIKDQVANKEGIVWATKGLDHQSGKLLHEIAAEILPQNLKLALLTGPSFATEVAKGLPTAVTLASQDVTFAQKRQNYFQNTYFRIYLSDDMTGAELGGAVKNVLAIAVGIAHGLGFGTNAKAAMITRGLAEMVRLGEALHARRETLIGLSGLGDLILTCSDMQSRNLRFGAAIGTGKSAVEAYREIGQVVEGVHTAKLIYHLAEKLKVRMPITTQVFQVLHEKLPAREAVEALLAGSAGMEY